MWRVKSQPKLELRAFDTHKYTGYTSWGATCGYVGNLRLSQSKYWKNVGLLSISVIATLLFIIIIYNRQRRVKSQPKLEPRSSDELYQQSNHWAIDTHQQLIDSRPPVGSKWNQMSSVNRDSYKGLVPLAFTFRASAQLTEILNQYNSL